MKKTFRLVLSVTMFAVLGVSEIPAPANCQMAYGGFLAQGCRMACCKTQSPFAKHCLFLKASPSNDLIASSIPNLDDLRQPLHSVRFFAFPQTRAIIGFVSNLTKTVARLFSGSPPTVRAPPADVYLLAA